MDPTTVLADALATLRPGAAWALRGPTLADLEWLDTTQEAPTQAEVDAQIARVSVPQSVTPRQARLALSEAGLLPQVNMMIRVADEATQITWDYATTINRTDPLIATLGTALSLTDAQIDALFVRAATL